MKDPLKRHEDLYIGPGGWRCPCCGPNHDKFMMRYLRKRARQQLRRQLSREYPGIRVL